MKTNLTLSTPTWRRLRRLLTASVASFAIILASSSCSRTGAYWGVDQHYPVGNGSVYYGAYGSNGPHRHYNKKEYKKYKKQQKKLRKQQKKHKKHHHKHHHDD